MNTRLHIARLLILCSIVGFSIEARAASQRVTFTFPGLAAHGVHAMGPGAARSIRIIVDVPGLPLATSPEGAPSFTVTPIQNPPGCAEDPKLSVNGASLDCAWDAPCVTRGESVTLCITSAGGPVSIPRAVWYSDQGDSLANARVAIGPPRSSCSELDCGAASAEVLGGCWPPNHRLAAVRITGIANATGPVHVVVTGITQDEPVGTQGDGGTCPDAAIVDGGARVRIERDGWGNGRVYAISFVARDEQSSCTGTVSVCVPHDQGAHARCIDSGQRFNSLAPCPPRRNRCESTVVTSLALTRAVVRGSVAEIEYAIPADGPVSLGVYDVAGRHVTTILEESQSAGAHQVSWSVGELRSGLYYYRLRVNGAAVTRTLLIAR
jgi:hypothetical protein